MLEFFSYFSLTTVQRARNYGTQMAHVLVDSLRCVPAAVAKDFPKDLIRGCFKQLKHYDHDMSARARGPDIRASDLDKVEEDYVKMACWSLAAIARQHEHDGVWMRRFARYVSTSFFHCHVLFCGHAYLVLLSYLIPYISKNQTT